MRRTCIPCTTACRPEPPRICERSRPTAYAGSLRRVRVRLSPYLNELGAIPLDPVHVAASIAQVRQKGRIRLRRAKWTAAGNHVAVSRRHDTPELSRSAVTPEPPGRVGHNVSPP